MMREFLRTVGKVLSTGDGGMRGDKRRLMEECEDGWMMDGWADGGAGGMEGNSLLRVIVANQLYGRTRACVHTRTRLRHLT